MAYWLYCIACQQWSKSSTPMSDDKTCSFCGKKYTKIKKNEETIIVDAEETQNAMETTETAEMAMEMEALAAPEENEASAPDGTPEVLEAEVVETIEGTEIIEEPEASEAVPDEPAEAPEEAEQTVESPKSEAPIKKASFSKTSAEKKGQPSKKR
ncbi:MAG: hypothetical protein H6Q64_2045 [Firmicutes bacterium]|nr:hypothetical protein [Bacillota bacterium]